ncbi:hypothetical protein QTP70_032427 [Hemibagrus guttatus]|uniref:Ig-like domain-containing protein n=1 Tax=Hemibagrus guttatus TaxID=175788 RepID=A0AAE0Q7F3_9TELE|nr:hypothetical protein QTP70_032427 [Hemibagrus guttatus]
MIEYKKSHSEWQCLSEVKMGRGSPIPPMLRPKIVEQYQKGVSQREIAKSLKLSSSTVHNIIQRFRESGTISVRKGQGRKTILDACDLRALRRHCITYRNATVMEITTWAQEYFQKTLSVNTIHRAIRRRRLKLYRSKKKPYLNMIQKRRRFLWAKAHLKWTVAKWKTVLWSDQSKFEVLFGKLGRHVIRTKEDKDNPSCYQRSVQKPASLMVWGCMMMKTLMFFTFSLHLSSAVTHSLQYIMTGVTPGINFPEFTEVGQVDGQQFVYYDSNIRKKIPKTEWIQRNEGEEYWNSETQRCQGTQEAFKVNVVTAMQRFNQTGGVHTAQRMFGCELHDDGTVRGYFQDGYDGEDFISLDLNTLTWIAPTPQALITKNKWDNIPDEIVGLKNYLENICIEWVKKYVTYGKHTLERKGTVCDLLLSSYSITVIQKHSPSPEVVCHATAFFPKEVMISWMKDGEDVNEDVELRETLPNQDGSFQKRSILKVPAEELQKHTYTCVIQHSSLKEELVLEVPKGGGLMAIIVGVVVALVVLVAVVAGIMVWKKKNSGFKRAPVNEDSSSNNSSNKA